MKSRSSSKIIVSMVLVTQLASASVSAGEIKVAPVNAIKEAYVLLVADFERATGHKVSSRFGGTVSITKRIEKGEVADLVIVGGASIDRMIASGRLIGSSRTVLAKSGVGVAIRAGLPKPDISTPEAVKKAVIDAKSIAYSSGPSGFYIVKLLAKLGVSDQVKNKVKQPPSGAQIADLLKRGEADLGFQQISELLHAKGIQYLGPLPPAIQNITHYTAALHSSAQSHEAAAALLHYLKSPQAAAVFRKIGMEPG